VDQVEDATSPYVLDERIGQVLWLTLNRPAQRNPLSTGMIAAIKSALLRANDDPEVRAVVIASSGPVFSAGHDLREMGLEYDESPEHRDARIKQILRDCAQMMLTIVHSPKAIIASVQGTATAAGCQLVSACDLAIAAEGVQFCTPGVNIGSFCTTPLVGIGRNIHRKHAMEMALTGDMFSTEDAIRFGLINRAVPGEKLRETTLELAAKIASKSAQGIRQGKEAFYRQVELPLEDAFRYANEEMLRAMTTPDALEGTQAFFQKRPPSWEKA
jgi:enoyl-CoA hydratase/carnithine racemase